MSAYRAYLYLTHEMSTDARSKPMRSRFLMTLLPPLILGVVTGCGSQIVDVPRGEWRVAAESEHVRYLVSGEVEASRAEIDAAMDRLEGFIWVLRELWPVPAGSIVEYYHFSSRDELRARTGRDVNGHAVLDRWIVHSIHRADAHEVAHLFTAPVERPLRVGNFWLEGMAMYYTWPSVYYDPGAVDLPFEARLGAWHGRSDALPQEVSYPAAGSFVTFLVSAAHQDREALTRLANFLRQANRAISTAEVERLFRTAFERSLADVETAWRGFIESWDEDVWGVARES
jgi:hypothetical protein